MPTDYSTFDDNFWNDEGGDTAEEVVGKAAVAGDSAASVSGHSAATEVVGTIGDDDTSQKKSAPPPTSIDAPTATTTAAASSTFHCPNCNSPNIESLGPSGSSVCTDCGIIVEENTIVSSVEFVEGAGGSSSMVGQFVGANSARGYGTGGRRGGQYGFSRQSRENTLASGKRRIQEVAALMRLGPHYVDSAHRLFTVAVERNFVQGRR